MMDWLRNAGQTLRKELDDGVSRFKNRPFMEAVVAGCALVSMADGVIKPEEKRKMHLFLEKSPELRAFKINDVLAFFQEVVGHFDFDFEIGKTEALKIIRKIKDNPEAAAIAVRVCCVIGASDGDFDNEEKAVVAEMCRELNLDPSKFGLA
jgi:tellurite resistance protein TerB